MRRRTFSTGCHPTVGNHVRGYVTSNPFAVAIGKAPVPAFHAVIILRVWEPDLPRAFKVPGYPVTPVLSVLACLYILYSLHWYTWLAFSAWVAVVLIFYFVWGRHHSALNPGGSDGVITAAAAGVDGLAPPQDAK